MCKTTSLLTVLLVIGGLAAASHATPSFEWVLAPEPGPVGGAMFPLGYTSWDLMYTVDTHVSIVEMYMESDTPAPGDFSQHPDGGITGPPSSGTISSDPFAEFDTYITMPGSFGILAAATDIVPGQRAFRFDDERLDITWAVSTGNFSGSGTFPVVRVTLKDGVSAPYTVMGWQRDVTPSISVEGILGGPVLLGDVNGDGLVDGADLTVITTNWGLSEAVRGQGDLNGNGTIDGPDYAEVLSYWAQSVPLPGDVNGDGWVNGTDLSIVIDNWGQSLGREFGDLNENGIIDGSDYAEVLGYWNSPSEPPSEAIPEPATLGLLFIGALALLRRRVNSH